MDGEDVTATERLIGRGQSTGFSSPVVGDLHVVDSPRDAMALAQRIATGEASDVIVLVHEAGGTTIGPLLDDVIGVVSTVGTKGAHIALLAREYGCACIIGLELVAPVEATLRVRLDVDGSISAVSEVGR